MVLGHQDSGRMTLMDESMLEMIKADNDENSMRRETNTILYLLLRRETNNA